MTKKCDEHVALARETLGDAEEYLIKLISGLKTTSVEYRTGRIEQGSVIYRDCVEGMEWFFSVIGQVERLFGVDYQELFGKEWKEFDYTEVLGKLFSEIIVCQKKEDWAGLADLLEYEVIPVLEGWGRIIKKINF